MVIKYYSQKRLINSRYYYELISSFHFSIYDLNHAAIYSLLSIYMLKIVNFLKDHEKKKSIFIILLIPNKVDI